MKIKKISGKTTSSLFKKVLQSDLRSGLKNAVDGLSNCSLKYSKPLACLIDVTTKCNLNCSWCIDKNCLGSKEISKQRCLQLIEELGEVGVKSIVYCGGGEPLMHKGIDDILYKTKKLKIDSAIYSNGVLVDSHIEAIAENCEWMRVSLDAGTKNGYKKTHENQDFFDRIINGLKKLNLAKRNLSVGVSFLIMENNYKEIFEAAKIIKDIGCNFIQFKPEYNFLNLKNITMSKYKKEVLQEINKEIKKAKNLSDNNFEVLITHSLEEVMQNKVDKVNIIEAKLYNFCAVQQLIPLIAPSGVYICPHWRGAKKAKLGDINNQSFSKFWNSEGRKKNFFNINPEHDCNFVCLRH